MIFEWILDNIVALLALFVAGWSAWYTKKYSGKQIEHSSQQTAMQRESLEMEKRREREKTEASKKAEFEVSFVEKEERGRMRKKQLRIENRGKGHALNVRWTVNDVQPSAYDDIMNRDSSINTISHIRSGSVESFKIATTKDSDNPWNIVIIWDDKAGSDNRQEFTLWR